MEIKIENERRFLVKRMPRNYLEDGGREITQWYICIDPPVRVRVENLEDYYLAIKIGDQPGKDYELSGVISKDAASILAASRKHNKVRKTRYPVNNLDLDVFVAQLSGLVLMEFEKKSESDVPEIPSDVLAEEVTCDERFRSHNLAKLDSIPPEWRCEIV